MPSPLRETGGAADVLSNGKSYKDIADKLFVHMETVVTSYQEHLL